MKLSFFKPNVSLKEIWVLMFCLPAIAFATKDPGITKASNQLTKITSDTVQGKFEQIQILYDQLNRVIQICQTTNHLSKPSAGNKVQTFTNILRTADFDYTGNNLYPTLRKRAIYRYDKASKKDIITNCQVQYFTYKDGKRVGDSIFNSYSLAGYYKDGKKIGDTILHNEKANAIPDIRHTSEYSISSTEISREHSEGIWGNPPTVYKDNLTYELNVINAAYELHQFNNDGFGYYFKFEKYDHAINPLKSINIAPYISSEMFDFMGTDLDVEGIGPTCLPINYLGWSYLNENNPISYTKNGSDGSTRNECILKNEVSIAYAYNKLNLPQRAAVTVKTINLRDPGRPNNMEGIVKRQFNFTYN
jgi:hypothetical protein